jgi:hypothetical protein
MTSPSQNGGESYENCARKSLRMRGSFYRGCGQDINASRVTEMKPRIMKALLKRITCNDKIT